MWEAYLQLPMSPQENLDVLRNIYWMIKVLIFVEVHVEDHILSCTGLATHLQDMFQQTSSDCGPPLVSQSCIFQ